MLLVYGVAPLMAGHALELAALRDCPCAPGLLLHLLSGSVLVPLGFLALPAHAMPRPPVLRGMPWAASQPHCGRCWGTWSMAPRSAGSSVPQHPRTRRWHNPGEPAPRRPTQT